MAQPGNEYPPASSGASEGVPPTTPGGSEGVPPATTTTGPAEVPTTRAETAFKSLIAGAIVLILLLVFILENTETVKISYFGVTAHLSLGIALLIAAIGGALLVGIVGTARIVQLRRHARRATRRPA